MNHGATLVGRRDASLHFSTAWNLMRVQIFNMLLHKFEKTVMPVMIYPKKEFPPAYV